jgi:tRNA(fMet)-specific endonuclease VapC
MYHCGNNRFQAAASLASRVRPVARYVLDTNIFIYIRQARPPEVLRRFRGLEPGEAAISVVTYGEVLFGLESLPRPAAARQTLDELISLIPVLELPRAAGDAYGRIRKRVSSRGELIVGNDLWIASHAIAAGLTLVTNNAREFRRVPGLRIENWTR